jgi:hypothetical protein
MKTKIEEFEVDEIKLYELFAKMLFKGVKNGDEWYMPTKNKGTIKLVVKERTDG